MRESKGPRNGNTEYVNTLAETEGPYGGGNDRNCMCRGEMRHVGATRTRGMT
jgi:hypothetical protein